MKEYAKVEYTMGQIKKAGEALANGYGLDDDCEYTKIVDNWRAAHAFPLDIISKEINEVLCNQEGVMIVQRLKRLESILGKLRRHNHTALNRMQDLGGCRVIVPDVIDVYNVAENLRTHFLQLGYDIIKENDYLQSPPEGSGYRSYHIVVRYRGLNDYDGMLVEIQIRTRLQNLWATAVEIIDYITNDSLKAGTGNKEYRYFFKLVSALFSIKECTPIVAGVPQSHEMIVKELYKIEREERIREKLSAYSIAIIISDDYEQKNAAYYLLVTDMLKREVNVLAFGQNQVKEAIEQYHSIEKRLNKYGSDVVLIAGHSFGALKESYQNYFIGAQQFLASIAEMCSDYPEVPSIKLDTSINSEKLLELFDVEYHKKSTTRGTHLYEDGIGVGYSKLVYCPDWAITLQESYLRFSGIYIDDSVLDNQSDIKEIKVQSPAIIVARTGACFLIEESEWQYISEADTIIISPKQGVPYEQLLLLLCWLKSNTFTWDLLWNKNKTSIYSKETIKSVMVPHIKGKELEVLLHNVKQLIQAEKQFVYRYNGTDNKELLSQFEEEKDKFNKDALNYLQTMESVFVDFYHITKEEFEIMCHEIKLKGYYSYMQ